MDDKIFKEIKDLCFLVAKRIDEIAKNNNVNQVLLSKLFIATFKTIIERIENISENKNG